MANSTIRLQGRIFLRFDIQTVTGLHIGGSDVGVEIGGVDKTVVRDPLTNRPYIPGSSLRGKMRSLTEKYLGLKQNQRIGDGYIHSCGGDKGEMGAAEYPNCPVCQVFGVPGERDFGTPTRLVVRDVHLSAESAQALMNAHTDLPFTEVKTEVSIDRVTSKANPRQLERVPAGAVFGGKDDRGADQPAELVYSVYDGAGCDPKKDVEHFRTVVRSLALLEDDYLGGQGARGSGKVRLTDFKVGVKSHDRYTGEPEIIGEFKTLTELAKALDDGLMNTLRQKLLPQK